MRGGRGNITRRGKASWQLKFDVAAVNGKRQSVTLPKHAIAVLRAHRIAQLEQRLVLGLGKITDDTFVFSTV